MKQTRISQEPLFLDFVPIEARFVPFQHSIIWQYNNMFWKHYLLWKETYHEDYEHSLPSAVPFSHKPSYIRTSTRQFFTQLEYLHTKGSLPEKIIVVEQGPGSGQYAKGFLDRIKEWSTAKMPFYQRIHYVLSDTSLAVLDTCSETLKNHSRHIELYVQKADRDIPKQYMHQALLVRHGNVWDQFPCQLLRISSQAVEELYTRAVLDISFEKHIKQLGHASFETFAKSLRNGNFENLIVKQPILWKPLVKSLRLETKLRPISALSFQKLPYKESLQTIAREGKLGDEVLFSSSVLANLSDIAKLVDWQRGGYIEIVDIIARSFSQLRRKRHPQKFDGAIAVFINGPLIKDYMRRKGKYVGFSKLKQLNTVATIGNYNLSQLLEKNQFVTFAEIAAKQDENKKVWMKKAEKLLEMQLDFVAFSDRAHGWDDFVPVEKLLEMGVYTKLPTNMLLQVFATRRKTKEEIEKLIPKLKQQGIENLLVVTGDSGKQDISSLTSLDVLPTLAKHFFVGAVAKPDVADIPKTIAKIAAGAKFFIVQSTYDKTQWDGWVSEIKRRKLYQKAHFIQSLIPIVTKKTITAIQAFPDVPVSKDIVDTFAALPDEKVAQEGKLLTKNLVKEYKAVGIFSGVYIFSRSFSVIGDMVDIVNS